MSQLELGEISEASFFAEYWRKKPLFVKGGARRFLGRDITYLEADAHEALLVRSVQASLRALGQVNEYATTFVRDHDLRDTVRRLLRSMESLGPSAARSVQAGLTTKDRRQAPRQPAG